MRSKRLPCLRFSLAIVILASCIGCDQATKTIATNSLMGIPPHSFLADTVRLDYALNSGGFLSLGDDLPIQYRKWIFIGFNSCLMLGLTAFLLVKRELPIAIFVALSYILAGGVGNLIDRVTNNGLVIDFINLGFGPLRTGVFNVADIAVTFGAIALGYFSLKGKDDDLLRIR